MWVLYPDQIGIWRCWFSGGRKTLEPGEKPSEQDENLQQTQATHDAWPERNRGYFVGAERSHHCANPYVLHPFLSFPPPPPTFKKNFRKSLFQRCHVAACFRWNAFQIHRRTMYAPHWALMSKFPFFLLIWCHSNSFSSLISGKRVFFWSDFYRWPIWANNETFPARYNTKASSDEYCSSASSLCQATGNETFNTREIFYIYDFL